ncbi:hypothetical protein [Synechococcus sp. CS-205]|uniref:hypothetical protein n=1 Tax=Synechococcus sp. CS-205 TaxID=2847984 RepID=UPI00223BD13A|nr:hypothetical protein [Synechococcus sp. CS-205]MCT0247667.1 hypothetical protein [Synechococcus sp. CS-205]
MDEAAAITAATPAPPPPVEAVVEWLLTGASERQVQEALAQTYPDANCGGVMKTVQQYLAHAGQPDADAVRGWALLSYRRLYQEMLRVGDYNGCRQVVKEICNLVRT